MNLLVFRDILDPGFTAGILSINRVFECFTLEDADAVREGPKIPGKTAIPAGKYRLNLDMSVRFKRMMPHIMNVPNFEGIRIHAGNVAEDTEGCILVGRDRQDGGRVLGFSRVAFEQFFNKIFMCADKDCWIEIQNSKKEG